MLACLLASMQPRASFWKFGNLDRNLEIWTGENVYCNYQISQGIYNLTVRPADPSAAAARRAAFFGEQLSPSETKSFPAASAGGRARSLDAFHVRSEVNNSLIIVNFFHKIQKFRQISDLFSQI